MDTRSTRDGSSVADSESSSKPRLQLPPSCDPPQPGSPTKQLVWIVSFHVDHGLRALVWRGTMFPTKASRVYVDFIC